MTSTDRTAMPATQGSDEPRPGISKVKLAVGAASLFLFIVGLKRTFRTDEGKEYRSTFSGARPDDGRDPDGEPQRRKRTR